MYAGFLRTRARKEGKNVKPTVIPSKSHSTAVFISTEGGQWESLTPQNWVRRPNYLPIRCNSPHFTAICRNLPQFIANLPLFGGGCNINPYIETLLWPRNNRQFSAIHHILPQFAALCRNLPRCRILPQYMAKSPTFFLCAGLLPPFFCWLKTIVEQNGGQPFLMGPLPPQNQLFWFLPGFLSCQLSVNRQTLQKLFIYTK